jgi:acyl-CoA thioesterase-1
MNIRILGIFITSILISACANNAKAPEQIQSNPSESKTIIAKKKTIVFFGNSLTAGYGLTPAEAFPALIQKKLDSLNLPYSVVNAGVSGETTSGGNTRIDWVLKQPMDVFVLELGGNDGLRGIPITETRKNLQSIIDKVKTKKPRVKLVLAGMQIPPNMGATYSTAFRNLYQELATVNNLTLIPFLLEGVGGEANLNQADGIHPTAEGHRIVAENIWRPLRPLIQETTP